MMKKTMMIVMLMGNSGNNGISGSSIIIKHYDYYD